jgi:hypothetical protein
VLTDHPTTRPWPSPPRPLGDAPDQAAEDLYYSLSQQPRFTACSTISETARDEDVDTSL